MSKIINIDVHPQTIGRLRRKKLLQKSFISGLDLWEVRPISEMVGRIMFPNKRFKYKPLFAVFDKRGNVCRRYSTQELLASKVCDKALKKRLIRDYL